MQISHHYSQHIAIEYFSTIHNIFGKREERRGWGYINNCTLALRNGWIMYSAFSSFSIWVSVFVGRACGIFRFFDGYFIGINMNGFIFIALFRPSTTELCSLKWHSMFKTLIFDHSSTNLQIQLKYRRIIRSFSVKMDL